MYPIKLDESYFPAQTDETLREITVGDVLREAAKDCGGTRALTELKADGSLGRSWNYAMLLEEAEQLAFALLTRFAPGERVAIWSPNTPEWAIFEFASAIAGLTLVTVNPAYQAKELRYILQQSRAAGLFLIQNHRGNPMMAIAAQVCADMSSVRHVVDLDDLSSFVADGSAARLYPVRPHDPVQIQYTSGTTGFPKGAVLSHRGLTNNARFVFARMGARPGDLFLNIMPMFHTSGCASGLLGSIQLRCPLLMARQFDPDAMTAIIEQEGVNLLVAVPTMLIGLLEANVRRPRALGSLRMVLSGGTMVAPELVRRIQDSFGCEFAIIYGQTESSPGLTQTRLTDSFADRTETVGQPFAHTDLSVRDLMTNTVMPIGTVGEICGRGYSTMIEYNDNPKATALAIDSDGWLHTGDLGTMDARGYVRVTGRVKDMIIRGGENIFPAEIENVLATHPAIAQAAVVGVPDQTWGEIVVCFLCPRLACTLDKAELVAFVRRDLAAPKTPTQWIRVDSFPLTPSGKIQKFVLRDQYVAGLFDGQEL